MHLAAIEANGFRNLNGRIQISSPLGVFIGGNNAGKSNVIHAIRLLFPAATMPRSRPWITEADFRHDGTGVRQTDTFDLAAELAGLTDEEIGRMVTCLAPSLGERCARLRLRARLREDAKVDIEWFGGDSNHPELEPWAKEAVGYTYLPPLRDAAADLRPGRDNRLVGLLRSLAPEGHSDRATVEQVLREATASLDAVDSIREAKQAIRDRLAAITGGGPFVQETDLAFADPRFERIVATLRAMAGDLTPLELEENGLGLNNLVYIAVLLAGIKEDSSRLLHLLLVEEPEAHLHPQLQDLLMRYLENESGDTTQVLVTSHSPNLASSARVERATVLSIDPATRLALARSPAQFEIGKKQLLYLHRFLDVTKAALLFARGVILVEGVAEQLLVPVLARMLDRPLERFGIAVINVGGVSFEPFIELFRAGRLPMKCSVVSDGDPAKQPTAEETEGGEAGISPRAAILLTQADDNVKIFLSAKTLEWDLVSVGNWDRMLSALRVYKPHVTATLTEELAGADSDARAARFEDAVRDLKGPFSQELAEQLSSPNSEHEVAFVIPGYLLEAIEWVTAS